MTAARYVHAAFIMSDTQCYSTSDLDECHQDSNLQPQLNQVSTDMGHITHMSNQYTEITEVSLLDPLHPQHFDLQHTSFYSLKPSRHSVRMVVICNIIWQHLAVKGNIT
jgi:hypothetical protein